MQIKIDQITSVIVIETPVSKWKKFLANLLQIQIQQQYSVHLHVVVSNFNPIPYEGDKLINIKGEQFIVADVKGRKIILHSVQPLTYSSIDVKIKYVADENKSFMKIPNV